MGRNRAELRTAEGTTEFVGNCERCGRPVRHSIDFRHPDGSSKDPSHVCDPDDVARKTAIDDAWIEGHAYGVEWPPQQSEKVTVRVSPADCWVGCRYDRGRRTLYVCLVPCVVIAWRFGA